MHPDKPNTFLCQYDKASGEDYYIFLNFNSIQAAKAAAHELLAFLGEDVTQPPAPAEAPPYKSCEEVAEETDPLTKLQNEAKSFSDLLRDYRAEHKYSQRELALLLGVSTGSVANWELGTYTPTKGTEQAVRLKLERGEFNG